MVDQISHWYGLKYTAATAERFLRRLKFTRERARRLPSGVSQLAHWIWKRALPEEPFPGDRVANKQIDEEVARIRSARRKPK